MKTIFVFIAALLIVLPAQGVVISCVNESNAVRIDYDASDETFLPVAFALDITVDGGAVITKVYDYKTGDSTAVSPGFGIFPRTMQFNQGGDIENWGTPDVAGLGTSKVTLEMASRYNGDANAPPVKGRLCRIIVDTRGASSVNVKTAQNTNGGGVVLENAESAKFTSVGCTIGTSTHPPSLPAAPASITYPTASSTGQYNVSWPASSTATSYQLERSSNSGSTWTQVYSGSALLYSETITNGTYRYHVRAANSAGSSTWTTGTGNCVVSISIPPTVPASPISISYPTNNNTGKYNIIWSSSTGATSYQLERSANNGSTWTQVYSGDALSYSETVANGSYNYRVKAANTAGSSDWTTASWNCVVSIPAHPSIPAAPASISYPANSDTGKYSVSWPSSSTATSYRVERRPNSSTTWTQVYTGSAISYSETVTNGTYSYRVRASNTSGSSTWRTGTTNCVVSIPTPPSAAPAAPSSITYPESSRTGRYTIKWSASKGAASYQLERLTRRDREDRASWTRIYSGSTLSFSENVNSGRYLYRVRAVNSKGASAWRTGRKYCEVQIRNRNDRDNRDRDDNDNDDND